MKIAVDISPISKLSTSQHKVRGVGSYITMLYENLSQFDKTNTYTFVEDGKFPKDTDLIHYPYFDPFFASAVASNKKFVVTVHDLTPFVFSDHFPVGIRGRLKWLIQKKKLKKATTIITDSDSSKRDVARIVGIDERRIKTVYLAADKNFRKLEGGDWKNETRKKLSLPERFLLYVGDSTWNKNIPRLLEAVRKTKYKLVMVGKVWGNSPADVVDHPWNKDLRKALVATEDNTQFMRLGFVDDEDLVKIYNLADALIMPSIYEGFGLPVLEAMSCACPVIVSKGGSLPEVAGDGALYVDEDNVESIREGIEKMLGDSLLRKEFSKKALVRSKLFSVKRSIEDLVNVYKEVI